MRKTQLLDNNPNSIYGASKNLANVSIRNIMNNPVQNDAMSQNLDITKPQTIIKNTNVDEFLGKILDCDSYLQQMYLYAYSGLHQYGNYGRYSYKDKGTSNVLERDDSDNGASGAGLSDEEDDEEDDESLTKSQLDKLDIPQLMDYYSNHVTNRPKNKKNNNSRDSEKTYKMTKEDYRSIGVDPSKLSFLNSSSPKRKAPLISKPSPIDVNNANRRRVYHDDTYEDFYHNSPQSSVSSHGGNPMRKDSTKFISPIVRKSGSSNSSTSLSNMSNDSLNHPRAYYFYDSSNPSSSSSLSHRSSSSSNPSSSSSSSNSIISSDRSYPSSSSSSSFGNSSGSSHYPASLTSSSSAPSNNSWNLQSLHSGYFDDGDDGDDSLSTLTGFTDASNEFKEVEIHVQLIQEMSKFNTKINELYIFFKGKIKPNLKTIPKQDIQDILRDMNQLDYNFTDVLHAIEDLDVFGLEKDLRHKKIDAFKQTFESNFKKSSADIISSVKAYSSLGMYSTSSVPDNILFNSKFPTFDGKGLTFIPDSVRKNMHHSHKYLQ